MPDDPNKNVEEQLKAWAQTRRADEGAPLELHPATRRLLQDEIARTFPKKTNEPVPRPAGWIELFWPRFALVGSLCVVLAVVIALLLPGLAKSKSNAQHLAMVRDQEKAVRPQTGYQPLDDIAVRGRDAKDEYGKTRFAGETAKAPGDGYNSVRSVPALTKSEPSELSAKTESKDARLDAAEQLAKAETRESSDKSSQQAYANRAKEAAPAAGTSAVGPKGYVENERTETLLRQNYGLIPAQTTPSSRADGSADKQKMAPAPQAPSAAVRSLALDGANGGPGAGRVGERGLAGGAANIKSEAAVTLKRAEAGATVGESSLTLDARVRAPTNETLSLAELRETDRLGTGNVYAYKAGTVSAPVTQQFAQAPKYRPNFNSPPTPNVLQTFRIEQTGRQIRLLDADGSVYDGAIEQAPTEEAANRSGRRLSAAELMKDAGPKLAKSVSAVTAGAPATAQNVFFRVAGTNRTLNQFVVFQGNLLAYANPTNAIVAGAQSSVNQAPAAQAAGALQNQSPLSNALIQGQATIGGSNRIEINASPVGP
jgi:hypothetical protein